MSSIQASHTKSSIETDEETLYSSYHLTAQTVPVWVNRQSTGSISGFAEPSTPAKAHHEPSLSSKRYNEESLIGLDSSYRSGDVDKSRWNSFIVSTSRPVIGPKSTVLNEKALEQQEKLNSAWIGSTTSGQDISKNRHRKIKAEGAAAYLGPTRYLVSHDSRNALKKRIIYTLLNNPFVPLTLRTIIFILSVAALSLACSIFIHSRSAQPFSVDQQPSTIMAVSVQCCALVYLVYITYDEYSGKPIGLREPRAKMRLIMLDLLFIIFSSANLSLTFNTLYDASWVCIGGPEAFGVPVNFAICSRQRGLASFLFMVLVMWVMTFTISIFRLVERVSK